MSRPQNNNKRKPALISVLSGVLKGSLHKAQAAPALFTSESAPPAKGGGIISIYIFRNGNDNFICTQYILQQRLYNDKRSTNYS